MRCAPWTGCSARSSTRSDASSDARTARRPRVATEGEPTRNSSLRTSASGMLAQQRMIDVIANNLANVNTTGFKRSRVSFEDVLYETVRVGRVADAQS
ncbi:MAG: flagellar basal body protein [bacterium]